MEFETVQIFLLFLLLLQVKARAADTLQGRKPKAEAQFWFTDKIAVLSKSLQSFAFVFLTVEMIPETIQKAKTRFVLFLSEPLLTTGMTFREKGKIRILPEHRTGELTESNYPDAFVSERAPNTCLSGDYASDLV